jgi:hypothetical protein
VVQRRVDGRWGDFADQTGEIPVTLAFPQGEEVPSYLTGGHQWRWTAHFEAFASNFDTGRGRATPSGTYRFLVDGMRRQGGRPTPYRIASKEFKVLPWSGVTVEDIRVSRDGTVSYRVGPRHTFDVPETTDREGKKVPATKAEIGPIDYPDSYSSPTPFIDSERTFMRDPLAPGSARRLEWYCLHCSFRPWADEGDAVSGFVTILPRVNGAAARASGRGIRRVRAVKRGDRWYARRALCRGERAFVAGGDVRDRYGNRNALQSALVSGSRRACASGRPQATPPRGRGRGRGDRRRSPGFTGR